MIRIDENQDIAHKGPTVAKQIASLYLVQDLFLRQLLQGRQIFNQNLLAEAIVGLDVAPLDQHLLGLREIYALDLL